LRRCAKYFVSLGVKKENLLAVDVKVSRLELFNLMQCPCELSKTFTT
jgi:hypothetical protein